MSDINAQQSTANKTPQNGGVVHKDKIKKIMKFEKVMKKFCKDIGIDKRTLISIIGGGTKTNNGTLEDGGREYSSSRKGDRLSSSKDNIRSDIAGGGVINTGIAAQFAYNNMVQVDQESSSSFMKVRNNVTKSRNNNSHSLTDNRSHDAISNNFTGLPGFNSNTVNEFPLMVGQRANTNGAPTNLRNYESENFGDQRVNTTG